MRIKPTSDVPQSDVTMEGAAGCRVRWLVGEQDQAPTFARRAGIDRFCLSDGRGVRVGYPTRRLRRKLGRKQRRRYAANKAVLALTTSRRFRARRIRVGTRQRVVRRRIARRPIRIGSNRWYVKRARRATIVFKVKRGRVRELGLVNKRLSSNRRKARRTLSSWRLR